MCREKTKIQLTRAISGLVNQALKETIYGVSLLWAYGTDSGIQGIHQAIVGGHEECAKNWFDLVMSSSLSNSYKRRLMMGRTDNEGQTVIFTALSYDRSSCVKAYIDAVLGSGFSDEVKRDLLIPDDNKGYRGLYEALKEGHEKGPKCYIESVANSSLPDWIKQELLASEYKRKTIMQNSGLLSDKAINTYRDAINESKLNDTIKQALLRE